MFSLLLIWSLVIINTMIHENGCYYDSLMFHVFFCLGMMMDYEWVINGHPIRDFHSWDHRRNGSGDGLTVPSV